MRGSLVIGQYLDSKQIEYLEKKIHLNLALYPLTGEQQKPDDVILAIKYLSDKNPIFVRSINYLSIIGYSELKDIYGNPTSVLGVDLLRVIYRGGQKSLD